MQKKFFMSISCLTCLSLGAISVSKAVEDLTKEEIEWMERDYKAQAIEASQHEAAAAQGRVPQAIKHQQSPPSASPAPVMLDVKPPVIENENLDLKLRDLSIQAELIGRKVMNNSEHVRRTSEEAVESARR